MKTDPLKSLNKLLVRSLLALGKTGEAERDQACKFAAEAWLALRDTHPREAERLNGVLHSLTQSNHPKEKNHVQSA
ncbi:MAG TPA: hypothetical protein VFK96_00810 [Gammaproteobacteria bacterium]|nr:hypothetical protein [Gammaproteobacteria bacterium]